MNKTKENLKKLKSFHNGSYGADIDKAIKALEQEPAYKVGKWIKQTLIMPLSDSTKDCVMCSECKTHWELEYNFCPNCGAKMESEVEE